MSITDELLVTGYPNSLRPELHKALKARGIDYWVSQGITFWNRDDGCECLAYGYEVNGVPKLAIKVVGFTDPEQAIAATLGSCNCSDNCTNSERTGTCHDEGDPSDFCCSECGVRMFTNTSDTYTMIASDGRTIIKHPNYCPNCGKVVEPTTNDVDAEVQA